MSSSAAIRDAMPSITACACAASCDRPTASVGASKGRRSINPRFGATSIGLLLAVSAGVPAQPGANAPTPTSAHAAAPIDITGHWVSLITDDWVYRMITPVKGDYSYVPLNAEGRRVADTWDPVRDEAAGEPRKSYSPTAIMRLLCRVDTSWQ